MERYILSAECPDEKGVLACRSTALFYSVL